MPKKIEENTTEIETLKQNIRRFLETIVEEDLTIFLGAGASRTADLPTMKELADILKNKLSESGNKEVTQFLSEVISILESESPNGISVNLSCNNH